MTGFKKGSMFVVFYQILAQFAGAFSCFSSPASFGQSNRKCLWLITCVTPWHPVGSHWQQERATNTNHTQPISCTSHHSYNKKFCNILGFLFGFFKVSLLKSRQKVNKEQINKNRKGNVQTFDCVFLSTDKYYIQV